MIHPAVWLIILGLKGLLAYLYVVTSREDLLAIFTTISEIINDNFNGDLREDLLQQLRSIELKIPSTESIDETKQEIEDVVTKIIDTLEEEINDIGKKILAFISIEKEK